MKVTDILPADENDVIELISVMLPQALLELSGIALESHWQEDKSGWMFRVDPENPAIPLQRHVHIAKGKHASTKNLQVSWNVDGTRHDKNAFNDSLGRQRYVQDLARRVLKLDSTITLEDANRREDVIVDHSEPTFSADRTQAYVRFFLKV